MLHVASLIGLMPLPRQLSRDAQYWSVRVYASILKHPRSKILVLGFFFIPPYYFDIRY